MGGPGPPAEEDSYMVGQKRYPFNSLWNEFDEILADFENRFHDAVAERASLPSAVLPAIRGDCRTDIREHEDEVIVIIDLPGVEKEDISIHLRDPSTLLFSCERKGDVTAEEEGYVMRERVYGKMKRTISLPADVTEEGTVASFKNGVLEIRLKKTEEEKGASIKIK